MDSPRQPFRSEHNAAHLLHTEEHESITSNRRSPITRLSTDILAHVLLLTLNTSHFGSIVRNRPDVRLMTVCRRWYDIIRNTASFWTFLECFNGRPRPLSWELWLSRSREAPLHLEMGYSDDQGIASSWFSLVQPLLHRLQSLVCINCHDQCRGWNAESDRDALDETMLGYWGSLTASNSLKHLELVDFRFYGTTNRIPILCPPNLEYLQLSSTQQIPLLQSASLICIRLRYCPIPASHISELLIGCPNLKSFDLYNCHFGPVQSQSTVGSREPPLPNLKFLHFNSSTGAGESKLMQWILIRSMNLKSLELMEHGTKFPFFNPLGRYEHLTVIHITIPGPDYVVGHAQRIQANVDFYSRWTKSMLVWLECTPNLESLTLEAPAVPNVIELILQAFLIGTHSGEALCSRLLKLNLSYWIIRVPALLMKIMEERALRKLRGETERTGESPPNKELTVSITNGWYLYTQSEEALGYSPWKLANETDFVDVDCHTFGQALSEFIKESQPILEELNIDELTEISDRRERLERYLTLLPPTGD